MAEDCPGCFVWVLVPVSSSTNLLTCGFSSSQSCCLKKRRSSVQICAWGSWDTVAAVSAQYGHTRVLLFTFWWGKTLRLGTWVSCFTSLHINCLGTTAWSSIWDRGCWRAYHQNKHDMQRGESTNRHTALSVASFLKELCSWSELASLGLGLHSDLTFNCFLAWLTHMHFKLSWKFPTLTLPVGILQTYR